MCHEPCCILLMFHEYDFVISVIMVCCKHSMAAGASRHPSRICKTDNVVSAFFV